MYAVRYPQCIHAAPAALRPQMLAPIPSRSTQPTLISVKVCAARVIFARVDPVT